MVISSGELGVALGRIVYYWIRWAGANRFWNSVKASSAREQHRACDIGRFRRSCQEKAGRSE